VQKSFKKVQKFPISIEICYFIILFDQFTRFLIKNIFRKQIKFSLIFCIQNKKNFSEKMIVPEINLLEPVHVKKNRQFWKKLTFFFRKVLKMANGLRI
jgi:hypothetical protein